MNILLLGSGGREHALAWKISQSKLLNQLYIAPGNAGTAQVGINCNIQPTDFQAIQKCVVENSIRMVIAGNEEPLVKGIVDFFKNTPELQHVPVIGPCIKGAALEGSKSFAKQFMQKYNIPTARYISINKNNIDDGYRFLEQLSAPYVLKADGLAAGKGVLIVNTLDEAKKTLSNILNGMFGVAGEKVVIEEFLTGIEVSMFVLTDGYNYKLLPEAKDYKRIGEGDTGLNTGGMGSVSPVGFVDEEFKIKVLENIVEPTLQGLQSEKINYQGFIFFGLMNVNGNPYLIEYNVRLGDPETQSILMRMDTDMVDLFIGVADQNLVTKNLNILPDAVLSVVCVSKGYPEQYPKGEIMTGLDKCTGSQVFHAGTTLGQQGEILTNGGRVVVVSTAAKTLTEARTITYQNIEKVNYPSKYFRKDIGKDIM